MLSLFSLAIGTVLACVLACRQGLTLRRNARPQRNMQNLVWATLGIVLITLSSCGGSDAPGSSPTTGSTSTAVSLPTGTATPNATLHSADWPVYHYNNARTGYIANVPDPSRLNMAWSASLDGAVYAEPLVVGGRVIVATEGDSLYSFDAATGKQLWHTNVGTPVALSSLPCGNIDPLGITGTPVYDPATKRVFAVAEVTGPAHVLVGLDVATGEVVVRRSVDLAGMDARVHQQRAALALSQGMIYIAYGGLYGDCGNYYGRVLAVSTSGQGDLLSYQVPTPREAGIWAPPGPVIDSAGNVYVSVGNGQATQGAWDHSDSVLRLSPTLQLQDGFAPTNWAQDNANDADLGSMGPVLLPDNLIFAAGKSGRTYLLHANTLGGVGGQITEQGICAAYGGSAVVDTQIFIPCTDGVRQITVVGGKTLQLGWQASAQINGSPIVGGHTVYTVDKNGTLYALNSATGAVRASIPIGATSRFATPTLAQGKVFVGTIKGIVAVTL